MKNRKMKPSLEITDALLDALSVGLLDAITQQFPRLEIAAEKTAALKNIIRLQDVSNRIYRARVLLYGR